jgi:Zn-dependent metalloprotease
MKIKLTPCAALFVFLIQAVNCYAQETNYTVERFDQNQHPSFITINEGSSQPLIENGIPWLNQVLKLGENYSWKLLSIENDKLGYTHYRLRQTFSGIPVDGSMYIVHGKNGHVHSANGEYSTISAAPPSSSLSEKEALASAIRSIGASVYKWQLESEEKHLKAEQHLSHATYYPTGELWYAKNEKNEELVLCYRFDIYAHLPLSRNYVFIDVTNGNLVTKHSRIAHADVPASGHSRYSGAVKFTCDSTAPGNFRLRETARGGGIATYNMQNGTNYGSAVDFTHPDAVWDTLNGNDTLAIDVHIGAEATYDYLLNVQGRNSIDGNGFALLNYVHYDNNFSNAFWDGQRMTYGDGDATIGALVSLDVCGHEIGHGLQQFTAGFTQSGEAGSLGESFSDILGLLVESYYFPSRTDVEIYNTGDQPGNDPNGIRNYIDPSLTNHPDTYKGTNWDNSGMNLHGNGVVHDHWFYILAKGKTGVNDNSDAYTVNGIGKNNTGDIAYRSLTVYLTPNSDFEDARFYSIQAAKDIFGPCSNEEIQTTNAWYAVGVGDEYSPTLSVDFDFAVNFCANPITVNFMNRSSGAATYEWDFGDGTTSTASQPTHTYSTDGTYSVKLIANGCSAGERDSLVLQDTIVIDNSINCDTTNLPQSGTVNINGCHGWIFDTGGREGDAADNTDGLVTVNAPVNNKIALKFTAFNYTFFGTVTIYDGPDKNSPVLATYDNNNMPTLGTSLLTSGSSISIRERVAAPFPGFPIGTGFEAFYSCELGTTGVLEHLPTTIQLYPNPTSGQVNLRGNWERDDKIIVRNTSGQLIRQLRIQQDNADLRFDFSDQPSGMYYLQWIGASGIQIEKFMLLND